MEKSNHLEISELLTAIRPWFEADQTYIVEAARQNAAARCMVAMALLESGQTAHAKTLLRSIPDLPETSDIEEERARMRALVELAQLEMEDLSYDVAEDYLWQARNRYTAELEEILSKEDISLWIAECRFGQGFVQDAIDRAEEILRKLNKIDAPPVQLAKTYQQLGWFYFHKSDFPLAFKYIRKAMELAPRLDSKLVDAGMEAERQGDFEKAMEHYFDALAFE